MLVYLSLFNKVFLTSHRSSSEIGKTELYQIPDILYWTLLPPLPVPITIFAFKMGVVWFSMQKKKKSLPCGTRFTNRIVNSIGPRSERLNWRSLLQKKKHSKISLQISTNARKAYTIAMTRTRSARIRLVHSNASVATEATCPMVTTPNV